MKLEKYNNRSLILNLLCLFLFLCIYCIYLININGFETNNTQHIKARLFIIIEMPDL